jgi:anti-sigma factor RsiW
MMTCQQPEIFERLFLYIDRELKNESERREFEEHIKTCPTCRKACDDYLETVEFIRVHREPLERFEAAKWRNRIADLIHTIKSVLQRPAQGIPAIALVVLLIGGVCLVKNNLFGKHSDLIDDETMISTGLIALDRVENRYRLPPEY